jgi:tetratricopeptide (TPR) repeat protein
MPFARSPNRATAHRQQSPVQRKEARYEVVKDMLLDLKSLKQELEFEARLRHSAGPRSLRGLGYVYAVSGRRDESRQVLDELIELAKRRYVSPCSLAAIYALLGDKDAAFEWLEKANRDGAYGILFLNVAPEWDGLRSEPRFQDLKRRVGLAPWEKPVTKLFRPPFYKHLLDEHQLGGVYPVAKRASRWLHAAVICRVKIFFVN